MKSVKKPFGIIQLAGLTTAMLAALMFGSRIAGPVATGHVTAAPQIYGGDVRRAIDACQYEARMRIEREQGFRGQRVNVNFDRPNANAASAAKVDVNGTGRFSVGAAQAQTFRYDCVYSAQRNTVNQLNYQVTGGGGNRPGYYPPSQGYPPPDYNQPGGNVRDGRYTMQLVATGRMLDVGNGGQVIQAGQRNSRSQEWDVRSAGGGLYRIINGQTGQPMGVNGPIRSGVTLTSGGYGSRDILWRIVPGPDGGFFFVTDNDLAIDSPSSARYDGGRMQLYRLNREANQRFRLNQSYGGGGGGYYPPNRPGDRPGGGFNRPSQGTLTWSGRVDDEIFLDVSGRSVYERRVSGQPTYNAQYRFSSPLPRNNVNVEVRKLRGRGSVQVVEQPSSRNNFTAVIRIRDGGGGADNYEIEVNWN